MIMDWRSRRKEEYNVGVRPSPNMRVGLTFVREINGWRTDLVKRSQNCRTRAKSGNGFSCFLTLFRKVVSKET